MERPTSYNPERIFVALVVGQNDLGIEVIAQRGNCGEAGKGGLLHPGPAGAVPA
jgi:hypothetical protein